MQGGRLWRVLEAAAKNEPQGGDVDFLEGQRDDVASESSARKKGRTVAITMKDMQKRRNDVKARTTLLLALPDEHQLRFSKCEIAKELWEAILKTFETLEQTFNRLQAILSHLEFIDVEIEQDDLNQKFLTSLAPEWLIGKGEVHTTSVPTASIQVSTASTDVAAASLSHDTICPKVEEPAPKALMANDGSGWDWSYMANEEENHDLLADDEVPTEFSLMAKSISSSDNEVDNGETRPKDNYTHKSMTPRAVLLKPDTTPVVGNPQNKINDKGYWDSGCSRHMTGNISYLSEYEPYEGGYVLFGHEVEILLVKAL
nr:ribonuclease H-like domain-containing protein [Tanacetum cinerariifolium]